MECSSFVELARHNCFSECEKGYLWPVGKGSEIFWVIDKNLVLYSWISRRVLADSTRVLLRSGKDVEVGNLCFFLWCPFSIGRLVACALDNYALASFSMLYRNQVGQPLVVYYLVMKCVLFQFILSFSPVYMINICRLSYFILALFSIWLLFWLLMLYASTWDAYGRLLFQKVRGISMQGSDRSVDKHFRARLANDTCKGWHECRQTLPGKLFENVLCEGPMIGPYSFSDTSCIFLSRSEGGKRCSIYGVWHAVLFLWHLCSMLDVVFVGDRLIHFVIFAVDARG